VVGDFALLDATDSSTLAGVKEVLIEIVKSAIFVGLFLLVSRLINETRQRRRQRRRRMGHCPECNYNLAGNLSGRCPECGTEITDKNHPPAEGE
jgi:uncharacterized paraquat-inducible protein A